MFFIQNDKGQYLESFSTPDGAASARWVSTLGDTCKFELETANFWRGIWGGTIEPCEDAWLEDRVKAAAVISTEAAGSLMFNVGGESVLKFQADGKFFVRCEQVDDNKVGPSMSCLRRHGQAAAHVNDPSDPQPWAQRPSEGG